MSWKKISCSLQQKYARMDATQWKELGITELKMVIPQTKHTHTKCYVKLKRR